MVKFIPLAASSHRCLFNKTIHTSFLDIFLVNFSVNFQSSLPQMLNFSLNWVCFVFEALFFKQHKGKVYSFNKVFTPVFLTNSQSSFQLVISFQSNFVQLFNFISLNCVCFVLIVYFQKNGKIYSFNKFFKTVSLVNFVIKYLVTQC